MPFFYLKISQNLQNLKSLKIDLIALYIMNICCTFVQVLLFNPISC